MSWYRTIAMTLLVLCASAAYQVRPGAWYVQRVSFEGMDRSSVAELRHLADLPNGTRMGEVDEAAVEEGLLQHPWVESVEVSTHWPDVVRVVVHEHVPVALVATSSGLFYVDASAGPFLAARSDDLDYPVVTGIDQELIDAHSGLPRVVLRDALYLLDELDGRDLLSREDVSEIRFSQSRGFSVFTADAVRGRAPSELLFGVADYERQLDRLERLKADGVDLATPTHVDVAPEKVAIVRSLDPHEGRRGPISEPLNRGAGAPGAARTHARSSASPR